MTHPRKTSGKSAFIDMTGRVCGTWTVLRRAPHRKGVNGVRWVSRHACGAEHPMPGFMLRRDPPKTCVSCNPYGHGRKLAPWLRGLPHRAVGVILGWYGPTKRHPEFVHPDPITSEAELLRMSDVDFLRRPGCGRGTLRQIRERWP